MKNIIIKIKSIIISAVTITILVQCGEKEKVLVKEEIAKPVKYMLINKPQNIITRTYQGRVEANEDAKLSFQVPGKITELPIKKGQDIKQGELIAKIDPVDYYLKYQQIKAIKEERETNLERTKKLLDKGYASQSEYDSDKARYDAAYAKLKESIQNIIYTELKAPFDGRIADRYVENFQYVNAKDPIALLHNKGQIDIAIDVPENIMIRVKDKEVLERVVIFESAPEKEYEVTYKDSVLLADYKTQTYKVYMTLKSPDNINALPGMTASVKFSFRDKDNTSKDIQELSFMVPITSIFTDENKNNYIWLINQETMKISAKQVVLGNLGEDSVLVTSGLKQGDYIVTAGVHLLRNNQLVSIDKNK